jgi:amidase
MSELWQLPATELAKLVRTREVSAREAAESALKRLDAVNPMINAIVAHRPNNGSPFTSATHHVNA